MGSTPKTNYRDVLEDDESLAVFLRSMSEFDQEFCDEMASGSDFTLRLEVRGDKGKLVHCRVNTDRFNRPPGSKSRKLKGT